MIFLPLEIEENIEISIIEKEIELGWSNFTSKCYYRGENSNELEMLSCVLFFSILFGEMKD